MEQEQHSEMPDQPKARSARPKRGGRQGGRQARVALRAAPLADDVKPVRPGLSSGAYAPLSDADIQKVHHAALDILENIGLADAIPTCIEAVTAKGGFMKDGRLCFPRALVEDVVASANRDFKLYAQDPAFDIHPQGDKVHFGTAGAAVHVVDVEDNSYRESTVQDLYDMARIADQMEHIHFFQRTVVCRDLPDPFDMDFHTCYAAVMGTKKHVGSSWVAPHHVEASLEMLHMIAGSEKKWRERPFVSMSNCFVVPPLKFAEESSACLEVAVRGGMPVLLLSAGQAGATAPAALAGAIAQATAEVLAGLVYANAIVEGAPCICGTWPFVSDLRTGAMSGGSAEQALLMAGAAQMWGFYDLCGGVTAGMTDAKMPDVQAGFEKGYTESLVGNSGANLIYESAGMHASLLGCSLESMVLDNDLIGAVLRTVRGIEVNDETLSIEAMRSVCMDGPGHYLGHDQTINLMQKEYFYPETGDRTSPKEWVERDKPTALAMAKKTVASILKDHHPDHIPADVDQAIRERFDIKISRETM